MAVDGEALELTGELVDIVVVVELSVVDVVLLSDVVELLVVDVVLLSVTVVVVVVPLAVIFSVVWTVTELELAVAV